METRGVAQDLLKQHAECKTCWDSGVITLTPTYGLPQPYADKRPPYHAGGGTFGPCPDCRKAESEPQPEAVETVATEPEQKFKRKGWPKGKKRGPRKTTV
jgi:hypothetical protein